MKTIKTGVIDYTESRRRLIGLWRATGNSSRAQMERLFNSWYFHPGAEAIVRRLARDYRLCLITGSFDAWAGNVARRLGVTEYYANTRFIWDKQDQLADYDYTLDQAGKKLEQLHTFCRHHHLEPQDCVAVGDSDNDLALFEVTGHGVAVGDAPPELLAVAEAHVASITELPSYLIA